MHSSSNKTHRYESLSLYRWYDLKNVVEDEVELFQDEHEATHEIESELKKVINLQSISDVPLGAFFIWRCGLVNHCFIDAARK